MSRSLFTRHAGWVCVGISAAAGLYVCCRPNPVIGQAAKIQATGHATIDHNLGVEFESPQVDRALFESEIEDSPRVSQIGIWKWTRSSETNSAIEPGTQIFPLGWIKKEQPLDPFLDSAPEDFTANSENEAATETSRRPGSPAKQPTTTASRKRLLQYQSTNSSTELSAVIEQAKIKSPVETSRPASRPVQTLAAPSETESESQLRAMFETDLATESGITRPVSAETIVSKPVVSQPAAIQPAKAGADVAESVVVKPVVTNPDVTKPDPDVVQPVVVKPMAAKPIIEKPRVMKPVVAKPVAVKPIVVKPLVSATNRVAANDATATEVFEGPSPERLAARERRKQIKQVSRTPVPAEEPVARAKVDQPEPKPTGNVELPVIRAARSASSPIAKATAPKSISSPKSAPQIVERHPVDQRRKSVVIASNNNSTRAATPPALGVSANRPRRVSPPPGWSAAMKLSGRKDSVPTIPRQLPDHVLDNSLAMPESRNLDRLRLPKSAATDDGTLVPSAQQPVTLDAIEEEPEFQVTRAIGDVPAELDSAVFIEQQSIAGQEPTHIREPDAEPIVIPELARQNHSPWLWWMFAAFGAGIGLCLTCCKWLRREGTD